MYTQCPECGLAFRVTTEILQQAAGKVRCGGCSNAFNALAFLSEEKPGTKARKEPSSASPDDVERVSPGLPPTAAEPGEALKTLDDLAGADIQIEDTGVEWRLVGGDDNIDELLDESPTPVDEFLTSTPNRVESPEVFENTSTPVSDELRFDDNTGLPDDYDLDDATPAPIIPDPQPVATVPSDEAQVEITLGEPDEWGDLLGEVTEVPAVADAQAGAPIEPLSDSLSDELSDDLVDDLAAALTDEFAELTDDAIVVEEAIDAPIESLVEAPVAAEHREVEEPADEPLADAQEITLAEELDALASTAIEDASPLDMDTQFGMQAEALGIDLSGTHETLAAGVADALEDELDIVEQTLNEQFPESTSELEFELAKAHGAFEEAEESKLDTTIEEDLLAAAFEAEKALQSEQPSDAQGTLEEIPDNEQTVAEAAAVAELALSLEGDDSIVLVGDDESLAAGDDTGKEPEISEFDFELVQQADDDSSIGGTAGDALDIPDPTDEEQTLNMMIDQELMNVAVTDDEGFTSTIVLEGDAAAAVAPKPRNLRKPSKEEQAATAEAVTADDEANDTGTSIEAELALIDAEAPTADDSYETIVIEADVGTSGNVPVVDDEMRRELVEAGFLSAAKQTIQGKLQPDGASSGRNRMAKIAAAVLLGLLLSVQIVHQTRAELATIPAINNIIAPVYRAIGMPISPDWDITGWRFEVTKGSTNPSNLQAELGDETVTEASTAEQPSDAPEVLTIYSRIGNQSGTELPYPLVSVSLTDRYEEIIGSKVLEPSEYLADDRDPRELVAAGTTFNAVISIESPSAEATGFKLNVCYRMSSGQLRCAIEHFK